MGKGKAIVLGLFTLWPLLYMFIFFGFFVLSFVWLNSEPSNVSPPTPIMAIFPLHIATMLSMFALIAIYLVLVIKNKALEDNMRIIWVILVITFGMAAMPAYWWLYVWKGSGEAGSG